LATKNTEGTKKEYFVSSVFFVEIFLPANQAPEDHSPNDIIPNSQKKKKNHT